jgi:polyhydroxyalkanoate synthase subunit PhaE
VSDWTEQSLGLWQSFSDAQQELWNGWFEAAGRFGAGAAPGSEAANGNGGAAPPWASLGDEWPERWQDMARKTLRLWTSGTNGVPAEVIDRMFSGEEAFLQFLDLSLGALKAVAPKIDAGEDWAEVLRRYLAEIRDGMLQGSPWFTADGVGAVAAASPELWSLYATEIQRFMGPWAEAIQISLLDSTDVAAGDRQAFSRAQTAFMDAFDGTFGRYASAPSVGYSRELNERVWRGFGAFMAVRRASTEFQNEMTNTGFHTYEKMLRELVEKGERGESVTTLRDLFDLWIDMGEAAYGELFATDGFAELQARLVNASMQYQMRSRELQEELLKAMGQPTRTEIDQVHRHVYDLRVEVRYMKRDMAAARQQIETLAASTEMLAASLAEAQQAASLAQAQAAAALAEAKQAAAQAEAQKAASLAAASTAAALSPVAASPAAAPPAAPKPAALSPAAPSPAAPKPADAVTAGEPTRTAITATTARTETAKSEAPPETAKSAAVPTPASPTTAATTTAAAKTTAKKTTRKPVAKAKPQAKPAAKKPEPGAPGEGR